MRLRPIATDVVVCVCVLRLRPIATHTDVARSVVCVCVSTWKREVYGRVHHT